MPVFDAIHQSIPAFRIKKLDTEVIQYKQLLPLDRSLSFNALTSSNVKPLSLNEVWYFFTVFLDALAAMDIMLRPWLYILRIFLILPLLIVVLAMLLEVMLNLAKMVAPTALAARSRVAGLPPESDGQYQRHVRLYAK